MDTGYVVVDAESDVVVAGAGIIGLSVALELAYAGLSVTVVERGSSMKEASWAAAGMLAAGDPENPEALKDLAGLSLGLYPEYLRRIEQLSARRIPLRTRFALQGSRHEHAFARGRAISIAEAQKLALELVDSGLEFRILDEESLDPRDLCEALPMAAAAAGIRVMEDTTVLAVASLSGQVVEVSTSRGKVVANTFINCSGSWAAGIACTLHNSKRCEISHESDSALLRIAPRKGQMIAVQLDRPGALNCVLRTPEVYLVPRGDGRIVIGATVEDAGFDKGVDPGTIRSLMARAAALWPPIASARTIESWAGLRPWSPDGLPVIGPICVTEGTIPAPRQWVATGHFRNGILLAPATARLISQLVRDVPTQIDVTPFSGTRFAPTLAK